MSKEKVEDVNLKEDTSRKQEVSWDGLESEFEFSIKDLNTQYSKKIKKNMLSNIKDREIYHRTLNNTL